MRPGISRQEAVSGGGKTEDWGSKVPDPYWVVGVRRERKTGKVEKRVWVVGMGSAVRVTERDRKIVMFAARHGVVNERQVRRRLGFGTKQASYKRLKGLVDFGLLRHDRVLYGQAGVYRATERGIRYAGVDLYPAGLDISRLNHSLEVVELSERLLRENPGACWLTERELRSRATRARLAEESERIEPNAEGERMPDGMLVREDGSHVAIELELSGKPSKTYRRIFDHYSVRRDLDEVRWYMASGSTRERAREIADRFRLSGYINFYPYELSGPARDERGEGEPTAVLGEGGDGRPKARREP